MAKCDCFPCSLRRLVEAELLKRKPYSEDELTFIQQLHFQALLTAMTDLTGAQVVESPEGVYDVVH